MNTKTLEILLIEDNPGDARLIAEAFKESEVLTHLTVIKDGVEAMKYLYEHSTHPDLVLLDLNLPKKDGREVLAEIKGSDQLKKMPVVVLTSSDAEDDIKRAYNQYANCYITKPVDFSRFLSAIRQIEAFWLSLVKLPPR